MWNDLLLAGSLVLIIEGLMPAISPRSWRNMVSQVADLPDRSLRAGGVALILIGAVVFHLVG
ncbi:MULTISPECIES: DUF2065 domain-containing protein [unclassified Wenzhouxiangella]|uniref:DUF2065 domain-containing protein n=1 Tax=unclassified Wenzhouxiangella TaxID=2613841 RepID=UPI000E32BA54|nr:MULTISPECIES: DUF2065 domain-containing protein [unclassified Wenzhouxiangella]RFF26377.1 DUF2065 domain-containing protein [Wenzhouxiangella sp. 15181]RFP67351.1 DUF2065 domain-containing protein [Wenzhouxiangella sp. 15190]